MFQDLFVKDLTSNINEKCSTGFSDNTFGPFFHNYFAAHSQAQVKSNVTHVLHKKTVLQASFWAQC